MLGSKVILHLLIAALLTSPAICCGSWTDSSLSRESSGDAPCPGHGSSATAAAEKPLELPGAAIGHGGMAGLDGCSGCAPLEAAVSGLAWPDEPGDGPEDRLPAAVTPSWQIPVAAADFQKTPVGAPPARRRATPVSRFDRLLLPG